MKLLIVLGTRPEVIKLAPVILEAKKHPEIELRVCSTGQHQEILRQALASFSIVPDIMLNIMQPNQSLSQITAKLMDTFSEVITTEKPDWVLVQGDTTSAFVAGLSAFYQRVKIGHVEAGLRTYNLDSPFPEELNRQLLGRVTSMHFSPTKLSASNLLREGTPESKILVTGNTVVDAIVEISTRWKNKLPPMPAELEQILASKKKLIFVTCHRRESFGAPLMDICQALRTLCEKYADYEWVYPVHPNPNVRETVFRELKNIPNLHLIEPLEYETTLYLISRSHMVLTDSGGIQEEAPSFSVPAVVMRNHTERQEGIDAGFATLAGTQPNDIIAAANAYLTNAPSLKNIANPYGDAKASARIIHALLGKSVEAFHG